MSSVHFAHNESPIDQPKLTMLDGSGPAQAQGTTNPRSSGIGVQSSGGQRARVQPKLTSFVPAANVSSEQGGIEAMADAPTPIERVRATEPVVRMLPSSEAVVPSIAPVSVAAPVVPSVRMLPSESVEEDEGDEDDDDLDDDLDEDDDLEEEGVEVFDPDLATAEVLREKISALPNCSLDAVALKKRNRPQLASLYRRLVSQST